MTKTTADKLTNENQVEKAPVFSIWTSLGFLAACFFIMEAGWGIRGPFGHSRGAMLPGAMLGLTIAVLSRRSDWWNRVAILGFTCAIGQGIAGQCSYSQIVSYASGGSIPNSLFGYSSIFLIGALYGGLSGSFLGLALTKSKSFLCQMIAPITIIYSVWLVLLYSGIIFECLAIYSGGELLHPALNHVWLHEIGSTFWLYDTIWICVVASLTISPLLGVIFPRWREVSLLIFILSIGWFAGMFFILKLGGFRMNPHRAESWAGVTGLLVSLILYLYKNKNRASLMLTFYGILAGGIGFSLGVFILMLARADWGPFGTISFLSNLNHWIFMKQVMGAFIGLGIGFGLLRFINQNLKPADESAADSWVDGFSIFFLFGPLLCFNLKTVVLYRIKLGLLSPKIFGILTPDLSLIIAIIYLIFLIYFIYLLKTKRLNIIPAAKLGRAQLLALLTISIIVMIYLMLPKLHIENLALCLFGIVLTYIILIRTPNKPIQTATDFIPAESQIWLPGWKFGILVLAVPFLLWGIAKITVDLDLKPIKYRYPQQESLQKADDAPQTL